MAARLLGSTVALVILAIAASTVPSVASAQIVEHGLPTRETPPAGEVTAAQIQQVPPIDVCLASDDSGSMWVSTDRGPAADPGPQPMRATAARVVVSLLGSDVNSPRDRVGAVLFGSATTPGRDIVVLPLRTLVSNAAREALLSDFTAALWHKQFTRIDAAIAACVELLASGGARSGAARIILLTDGVPESGDPAYDAEGQVRALSPVLGRLADQRWPVDVILLGPSAPLAARDATSFAARIAAPTGGGVYAARDATDLLRIYTRIVSSSTGRDLIAGEPVPVVPGTALPVTVPRDTETMTVTVVKSDIATTVTLRDPAGRLVGPGDQQRSSTGLVDAMTVERPQPGEWRVELDGQGTAYVSLVMRAATPPAAPTAAPTEARLPALAPAATDDGEARTVPWRAIARGMLIAAVVAGSAGAIALLARAAHGVLASRHLDGVAALAAAPARRVSLRALGAEHRMLLLWQRPAPVKAVLAALGKDVACEEALGRAADGLRLMRADGEEAIDEGVAYEFGDPPVALVFARDPADLPAVSVSFVSPRVEDDGKELEDIDGWRRHADDGVGSEDGAAPAGAPAMPDEAPAWLAAAEDPDRWGAHA